MLGYKDYKRAIQKNVTKDNKKKPLCQDTRYLCHFLNKDGVNELINKSRKTVKKQLLEFIKKGHEAPMKFKSNSYKEYSKKPESRAFKYEKAKSNAIKEALEDAEINYGLDDYLTKVKKCYDNTYYENVDEITL